MGRLVRFIASPDVWVAKQKHSAMPLHIMVICPQMKARQLSSTVSSALFTFDMFVVHVVREKAAAASARAVGRLVERTASAIGVPKGSY